MNSIDNLLDNYFENFLTTTPEDTNNSNESDCLLETITPYDFKHLKQGNIIIASVYQDNIGKQINNTTQTNQSNQSDQTNQSNQSGQSTSASRTSYQSIPKTHEVRPFLILDVTDDYVYGFPITSVQPDTQYQMLYVPINDWKNCGLNKMCWIKIVKSKWMGPKFIKYAQGDMQKGGTVPIGDISKETAKLLYDQLSSLAQIIAQANNTNGDGKNYNITYAIQEAEDLI